MTSLRARIAADPLVRIAPLLEVRKLRVAVAVARGFLALGSAVGLAAVAAWLIARASQMPPVLELSVATVAVRTFGIGRGVARYLERLASHDVALRGMTSLRARLYENLAEGPGAALAQVRRGDLLARVGTDVDDVGDVVVRAVIPAGVAACVSLLAVGIVGVFLPSAGVILLLCLLLAGGLAPWLSARAAAITEERSSTARAEMAARTVELLENAGPAQVDGSLEPRMRGLARTDRDLTAAADEGARTAAVAAALQTIAVGLAVVGALALGIPAVAAGTLAPVELAVVVLTPLAAFEGVGLLPAAAVQVRRSRKAASRLLELLDETAEARPSESRSATEATDSTDSTGSTDEGIRTTALVAGWDGHPVVTADLTLAPGRTVGLVGPSGVGKSTLLATLAGLIPPVDGTVGVDGLDLAGRHPEVLMVAEDGHVFATTILENLRVARGDVTEADAHAVLDRVGLTEWVDALPRGLDTLLGPDGATVSGGERRRLLIARALLSPARYLLVDEPTEHLDPATADALLRVLVDESHRGGRGIVVATHRLTGLEQADEVIALRADPTGPANVAARGTQAAVAASNADYAWALAQESAR
ncbi:ATP-binding cassette, subfamily C, CydC [Paraoerskovia marina]|uniref:ATP-binding cassette, subfamily C, CydC n=1 Tax=Paraoerskovia marina TaxID=545619 RepID=A0A1H1RL83_9CELL|nr:thiol reductant ABC exporter subunit CydC [Paraoerskovia marina]SDS36460.1 ATP-binding cassette, subfamily C, CydC [Paraoerskovia marina]